MRDLAKLFQALGLDGATYIAVLTHDPKLDDSALTVALPSEAAYIGAPGSRRTQAKRRAGAVIVDPLTPPMTRAESYGPLADLEQLLGKKEVEIALLKNFLGQHG